MGFCYSILIQCYHLAIRFAALFSKKARNWLDVRKNWQEELFEKTTPHSSYCWVHCASAGEFEQAIPLLQSLKSTDNSLKTAVSFFSASGFELYKNSGKADLFFHFPIDTKENACRLIQLLRPVFVLFIRNEIWWNTLSQLKTKEIPAFLVNAPNWQKRSLIYQKYLDRSYPLFTKIFDTSTYGDTKLEQVLANRNEAFADSVLEDFCKDAEVILVGSSWQTEESYIASFYQSHRTEFPNLKIILAPHDYDEYKAVELRKLFSAGQAADMDDVALYSSFIHKNNNPRILFLDKKGILKYAYRFAAIAFIGGGFDKTVHNVAEAAVYGIPTTFGPNFIKFEEIVSLTNQHIAFPVSNYETLEDTLLEWLLDHKKLTEINSGLSIYFEQQLMTSGRIIAEILAQKNSRR
ncbi:MAG: hypothetical protein IPM95_04730 [Sphingobacteriales bacterium]|nr:hypothetical protein [Sphingobacteriales bacterium]